MTIADAVAAQIAQSIAEAYAVAVDVARSYGTAVANQVQQQYVREADYRRQLFTRLGQLAQESVLQAYNQMVVAQEGPASATHYRRNAGRLAGGVLYEALADEDFFSADSNGLNYANLDFLDFAAAHWYRLNYGAGARGQGAHDTYPVNFGTGNALTVTALPSGKPFILPPGVFLSGSGRTVQPNVGRRGQDAFYPGLAVARSRGRARTSSYRTGLGIKGKDFLGEGLRRLAEEIPRAYETYTQDLLSGSIKAVAAKRQRARIQVRLPSPDEVLSQRGAARRINLP